MTALMYQSGFGNQFSTEALAGALPQGRNSPQQVAMGLYAELVSGSAFTAPRAENRRSWLYRRQPSVVTGTYVPYEQPYLKTGAKDGVAVPPDPLRWHPAPIPEAQAQALDFVDGLRTVVVNGDVELLPVGQLPPFTKSDGEVVHDNGVRRGQPGMDASSCGEAGRSSAR